MRLSLDEAKALTETIVPWVSAIALITGGIWTLLEYRGHLADSRVERSLALIARFNDDLSDRRLELDAAWERHLPVLIATRQRLVGASADDVRSAYEASVTKMAADNNLAPAITEMIFFF